MKPIHFALLATAISFIPFQSFASTSGVSSGSVKPGSKIVARASYSNDNDSSSQDDRVRSRIHYEHGFSDSYALRLIAAQDKRDGESLEHESFRIENRFQFFEQKEDGFNGTIRLGYRNNASRADEVQIRFNGSTQITDDLQYKQNIILAHEVFDEAESGLIFETRFALEKDFENFDLGIDMLNDFGNLSEQSGYSDQSHTIGAYYKDSLTDNVSFIAGYRHGISEGATDNAVRLFVTYGF